MANQDSGRNTQTRVKHEILSKYLDTWGGIIVNSLSTKKHSYPYHFVYVDCFSFSGKYVGESEDVVRGRTPSPVYGSPIIGIRALDKLSQYAKKMGVRISTNTILIEREKPIYENLLRTLQEAKFDKRVRKTDNFTALKSGEIALINADSTKMGEKLTAYTVQKNTWAFYLIDPYGPSGIPYGFVKQIITQENHDVMINFIYEDLLRKTGMAVKDNLAPQHQALVDNCPSVLSSVV